MVAGLPKVATGRALCTVSSSYSATSTSTPTDRWFDARASVFEPTAQLALRPLRGTWSRRLRRWRAASAQVGSGGGFTTRPLPAS